MAKFGKKEIKEFIDTLSHKNKFEPDVISKIRQAFSVGCTDEEACYYAEISPSTYYRWMDKYPKLKIHLQEVRERLGLKSKENIAKVIEGGDVSNSWRYLERTQPDVFAETQKLKHSGEIETGVSTHPEDIESTKKYYADLRANRIKRSLEQAKKDGEIPADSN